jgi:general stress protein YciG
MIIFQEMNMADNNQGNKSNGTGNRGFASMDEEKQRAIASQGGRAAHASGNAHEFSSEEAREAGRKGGQNSHGGSAQNANSGGSDSKSGSSDSKSGGTRGGSSEQHAKAGSQSHKNK